MNRRTVKLVYLGAVGLLLAGVISLSTCAPKVEAPPPPVGLTIPTDARIVVRHSSDITGPIAATLINITNPILDYYKYINEQGGIEFTYGGKKYRVKMDYQIADDKYDLALSQANYKRFLPDKPHFFLTAMSGVADALQKDAAVDKVVIITYGVGTGAVVYELGWTFGTQPTYAETVGGLGDWIKANWKDKRAPRLAYVIYDSPAGRGTCTPEVLAYLKNKGIEVVDTQYFSPRDMDVTSQLLAMKGKEPDFVVSTCSSHSVAVLLKSAYGVGISPAAGGHTRFVVLGYPVDWPIIDSIGKAAEGGLAPSWTRMMENGPSVRLHRELAKKYRGIDKVNIYEGQGMMFAQIVAEASRIALEKRGWPVTGDDIYEAMQSLTGNTLGELVPPLPFSKTERRGVRTIQLIEVKKGDIVTASDWIKIPSFKPGEAK